MQSYSSAIRYSSMIQPSTNTLYTKLYALSRTVQWTEATPNCTTVAVAAAAVVISVLVVVVMKVLVEVVVALLVRPV